MYASILQKIKGFRAEQKGVTMIEYGVIAALIAAVSIGVVTTLGGDVKSVFTNLSTQIAPAKVAK